MADSFILRRSRGLPASGLAIPYCGPPPPEREDDSQTYPPGAVVVLPGGTPHFHWAKSGEYVTQVTAFGPISLEYLDPEDDPRNR
jgi:hypothetical protein